uniref:Transcription factor IIIB 50 kDa subunit n=1 Tax=Coturnix japonica TaxID=93934 RepID=A0A8C2YDL8_COTJA
MADRGLCPECGSAALLEDAHYAQQQLVCAACGCVLAEGLLTTTYSDEGQLREVAYSQSTGQKEQLNRCEQRGKAGRHHLWVTNGSASLANCSYPA